MLALANPFENFGVTQWSTLIAYAIAFLIAAWILKIFAFQPVLKMLDERKARIKEGEDMRIEAQNRLENTRSEAQSIIDDANTKAEKLVEEAIASAVRLGDEKKAEAQTHAEEILARAKASGEAQNLATRQQLEAEFVTLLARATSNVTGKILTPEDRKALDNEVISKL